mmetsp:Transcript_63847/g.118690  ORF Transcript_63847/g.118690 Transcript_63847/m.118690 type:complete len:216 (-) Transcript_63847:53-700(-)
MGCSNTHGTLDSRPNSPSSAAEQTTSKSHGVERTSSAQSACSGLENTPSKSISSKPGGVDNPSRADRVYLRLFSGPKARRDPAEVSTRMMYSPRNTSGWMCSPSLHTSDAPPSTRRRSHIPAEPESLGSSMLLSSARLIYSQETQALDPDFFTTDAYLAELNTYLQTIQDNPDRLENLVLSARDNDALFKAPPQQEGFEVQAVGSRELRSINLLV